MKPEINCTTFLIILLLLSRIENSYARSTEISDKLTPVDSLVCPNLFTWTDVCNVYVLKDGDAAIFFDLGDGSILKHLKDAGIKQVDWVLFTHHHREQCQGYSLLRPWNTKIAVPDTERSFFEIPDSYCKMKPSLNDPFAVYGSSYLRPPVDPVKVSRGFSSMDTFTWHGYEIRCCETPGNSPGAISYFLNTPKGWIAFTGDVMMNGENMHTWFDTEWDYGYASGIYALHNSAAFIADYNPVLMLPSHGPVITNGKQQLANYQSKLRNLAELLIRGYDVLTYSSSYQDKFSKPTSVPDIWQISPHLYKFKGPDFFPNFTIILADNGHALAIDCGLFDKAFLNARLDMMRDRLGLKKIDAVMITHMHGDHFLDVPLLKEKYGSKVWALDRMIAQIESPARYNYAAMGESYDGDIDSLMVDRVLHDGEMLTWEGFELTADWLPGQTEFGMCINGMIDGKKVAFTGDNIFGDPDNQLQSGHEAVVARNSAILEEGYIYCADYLKKLNPDLIIGGHSFVMANPSGLINRFSQWTYKMYKAFEELSWMDDYRYWYDPFWVKAEPYRITVKQGQTFQAKIVVRNFSDQTQEYHVKIDTPPCIEANPSVLNYILEGNTINAFTVKFSAAQDATPGVNFVGLDVTVNKKPLGEWFDAIIELKN